MISEPPTTPQHPTPPSVWLCYVKWIAALLLLFVGLVGILITALLYTNVAQTFSSAPVYEADPARINPAYEGEYVKMRVTELHAEGGPVEDALFGLCYDDTVVLQRYFARSEKSRIIHTSVDGIKQACIVAPVVKAGAYRLKAREEVWRSLAGGGESVPAEQVKLPAVWEGRLVEKSDHGITIRTGDTSNLATPHATLCFLRVPSPWRGELYVVGKQKGNVLDMHEIHCGLIRGEKNYQEQTRIWPLENVILHREWELVLCVLLLADTLCLLPLVCMVQKRGWQRAAKVALAVSLLLCGIGSAAMLLLFPHITPYPMAWCFVAAPVLLAIFLFVVRRKTELPV